MRLTQRCEILAFQCKDACGVCPYCGGFQRLLCPICHGSKRSVHRNEFTVEFVALKCAKCDVFGMIRCPHCWGRSREGIHVHLLKSFLLILTDPSTNLHSLFKLLWEYILCYALSERTYTKRIQTLTDRIAALSHVVRYRSIKLCVKFCKIVYVIGTPLNPRGFCPPNSPEGSLPAHSFENKIILQFPTFISLSLCRIIFNKEFIILQRALQ